MEVSARAPNRRGGPSLRLLLLFLAFARPACCALLYSRGHFPSFALPPQPSAAPPCSRAPASSRLWPLPAPSSPSPRTTSRRLSVRPSELGLASMIVSQQLTDPTLDCPARPVWRESWWPPLSLGRTPPPRALFADRGSSSLAPRSGPIALRPSMQTSATMVRRPSPSRVLARSGADR